MALVNFNRGSNRSIDCDDDLIDSRLRGDPRVSHSGVYMSISIDSRKPLLTTNEFCLLNLEIFCPLFRNEQ